MQQIQKFDLSFNTLETNQEEAFHTNKKFTSLIWRFDLYTVDALHEFGGKLAHPNSKFEVDKLMHVRVSA